MSRHRMIPIQLAELIAAHGSGPEKLHYWVTAIIDGAFGDAPTPGDPAEWRAGVAIGRRCLGSLFRAQYLDATQEWRDAGEYVASCGDRAVTLQRVRVPETFCPAAIDRADKLKVSRETWDAGERCFFPGRAGIPLVLQPTPKDQTA